MKTLFLVLAAIFAVVAATPHRALLNGQRTKPAGLARLLKIGDPQAHAEAAAANGTPLRYDDFQLTIKLQVGTPPQSVELLLEPRLSATWITVPECHVWHDCNSCSADFCRTGGCYPQCCADYHGDCPLDQHFDPKRSSSFVANRTGWEGARDLHGFVGADRISIEGAPFKIDAAQIALVDSLGYWIVSCFETCFYRVAGTFGLGLGQLDGVPSVFEQARASGASGPYISLWMNGTTGRTNTFYPPGGQEARRRSALEVVRHDGAIVVPKLDDNDDDKPDASGNRVGDVLGGISFGEFDSLMCSERLIATLPLSDSGDWSVSVDSISVGKSVIDGGRKALIDPRYDALSLPRSVMEPLKAATSANYDEKYNEILADCDSKAEMTLDVGSSKLTFTPEMLISRLDNKVCKLNALYGDNDVVIGSTFLKHACATLNVDDRTLSFSRLHKL